MATSADIGANFSDYQGNAGLGNVGLGVIKIDTRPLEQLAHYTFIYNKAQFEQKQKDAEAKAKQLADLTAYDLTTAIPKDGKKIQEGYEELYNLVRDDPTVLDYKNNQEGWMKYNKKKNEFENQLQGGKARSILYTIRQQEVTNATSPKMKEFLQKQLDDEANSTDLMTPLKHTQLYDIAPIEVAAPPSLKLDVTNQGANFIGTRTYELPDMASVDSQATTKALGFTKSSQDPNSPEFQAQTASGKLEPVESSKNITAVLQDPKYKDAKFRNEDGTLNLDAVIKDNANNALVSGVLSSVKQYNDKMDEMSNQIRAGYFSDKLGKPLSFGVGGLNEKNYRKIDLSDGFTPDEILKVRILGLAKPITYSTKIDQTNESIAKQNVGIAAGHLNETIRHNKASENLASEDNKLNEEKWKASQVGGTTQINGAMERAKRIYKDMLKLTDKYGVINPDKIRQLNVEQLKYLGIEVPETIEGGTKLKGGFKPLTFEKDKPYAIQLINGEIRVLKGAKKSETSDSYKGEFDPTKSTNLYNIGTNILNEELLKAGSKELNAFTGIDIINGVTTNTDGGSQTQSGSTKTKKITVKGL